MRDGTDGMAHIEQMCNKLSDKHQLHISLYGENKDRLTGIHETSSVHKFSYGCGDRSASVRIPTSVKADNGKGYIEDRRPASDIDPYIVASIIIDTTTNDVSLADPMVNHYGDYIKEKEINKIPSE
jgi:glutamine synthetase